jgi:two-component sensor histidine kinase
MGLYIYRIFGLQNIYTVFVITLLSATLPLSFLEMNLFDFRTLVPDWNNYPPSRGLFLGGIVLITLFGYIQQAGLLASDDILRSRRQIIINTQLATKPYNKEIVQISRNWARHLHGRVQSQILAATFTLEKAQEASDLEGVKAAFNEIVRVLLQADKLEKFEATTLKQELAKRTEQWSGIIEIDMRISPELASRSGMEIHVIADIVEEMITNASRHGAASTIRIELARRNPTQLSIKSIDNGSHFDIKSKGFGSRFFDEVSQGRWDISRNAAFAETTVSVLFELENIYVFPHHPLAPEADI